MKYVLPILLLLLLPGDASARGGHSFSGGGHSSFGHSYSAGGHSSFFGKSYSSNGSSSKSGGSSWSFFSPSSGGSKSYSSVNGKPYLGKSAALGSKGTFDTALTGAGRMEDSRLSFQKHYTTPTGTAKTYTPADYVRADRIRGVDYGRYRNYDHRVSIFYGNSTPVYYNDYWSPFLNAYLISSAVSAIDRASWVYNHRDSIDDARYQDLLAHDAGLADRVRQLEKQNAPRDPNYVLPTMADNPDLMYSKGFVESARQQGPSVLSVGLWTVFVVAAGGVAVWLLFIREW